MNAAILSIGDELTLGQNVDTNSAWLSGELADVGVTVIEHRTVEDERSAIAAAVRSLAGDVEVLLITGGLGPTVDDVTRDGLGDAIDPGVDLVVDADAVEQLDRWFAHRDRAMPETNHRQTFRPVSMRILENPRGTAPGLTGQLGDCVVYSMPGPPPEMRHMYLTHVRPELEARARGRVIARGVVCSFGLGEALAAERMGDVLGRGETTTIGITASQAIITARIRCTGVGPDAVAEVSRLQGLIEECWAPYAFARDDRDLASIVGELLKTRGATLATAESCTGGWLGKMIVDVPGSSDYYRGGWVTYTNDLKKSCLDVPADLLDEGGPGAVSEETACAMAQGAIVNASSDYALAITGIAGPEGGTPEKPVGLVYIALGCTSDAEPHTIVRRFEYSGDRGTIRNRAAMTALQMLRFAMLDLPQDQPMLWETQCPAEVESE